MKRTGKTLTLSGQMPERSFGAALQVEPHTILEYANVLDIKRAWRVKDFHCWIQQQGNDFAGQTVGTQFGMNVQLSSDDIPNANDWNNAGDNRAVGWGALSYFFADGQYKPQSFTGTSLMLMNSEYWMMEDHVIQNKLTISASAAGNGALEGITTRYKLNYIVNLEEFDITPVESIVFNIKSKAQDLSS